MITNLFWALIYNIIGIPLAAGLLYTLTGYFLLPYLAAVFMASSSVSVVTNALFLKRYEPKTKQQIQEFKLLTEERVIDPICGMEIVPSQSIEYKYKDKKYYFCSAGCEKEFKLNPEKYMNFDKINPKLMQKQSTSENLVTDPICGMKGKPEDWIEYEYKGEKYYFCSNSCLMEFKQEPDKYFEIKEESVKSNKKEVKEKLAKLKCVECGFEQDLPKHCGKPMHEEDDQLVCWMGSSCGTQPIPKHHGKPMQVI